MTYRVAVRDPEQERWRLTGPVFDERHEAHEFAGRLQLPHAVIEIDARGWPMRMFQVKLELVHAILDDLTKSGDLEG